MSTHKYLDTTGLGQVWGKIKDYADDAKTMVVTVSRSNDNYVADKTFSEIVAHVNSGGTVICKNNNGGDFQNEIYELGTIENNYIIFHLTQLYDVDNNNDGYSDQVWFLASHIIISNNNVVEVGDVVNGPLPDASTTTPLAPGVASSGTEYERYALGDHVHPSELFVVNITSTTTEGVTTYSANKTFAEITAAYNAGKSCRAVRNINNNSSVYTLIAINSSRLYFTFNSASNDTLESTTLGVIRITNTNEVSAYSKSILTLSAIRSRFAQKPEIAIVNGTFNNNTDVYDFSATAVQAYSTGDLFWLNYNVLAKATTDIASGATLTENTNYVKTTIADELKSTASIIDEKLSTGTIGSGVYYPIVGTNTASATTKYIDSTGFKYDATSSTNGYARLYLGNGTASGTEGSKYGRLMIYGTTAYGVTLDSGSPTENRTISLPNKNGTIALTSDVPTKVSDLTNDSGFISSYTETDPVFSASAAHGITSSDISNWNSKASNLSGLNDTTISSPTNGQVLMYNSTTSKWENTSLPIYNGGVSS